MPSQASLDMIRRLIAFDTTSRNSNLDLIHDVRDYLAGLGIEAELVHDESGGKANLYATLGPKDRGGIALSGHTDVVPIDGQDWDSDPWATEEKGGKLYGRGTCDMKSFIAIALAQLPRFAERELTTPLHLCFSYDEEVGCIGVRRLLDQLAPLEVKPRLCIIGEPTDMKVINAHKGKFSMRCRLRGYESHSSLAPTGVNAIDYAAKLIVRLAEMAAEKAENGPFDAQYDVAHTTVHTGVIEGGTALNIVPRDCFFDFEFRTPPAAAPDALSRCPAPAGRLAQFLHHRRGGSGCRHRCRRALRQGPVRSGWASAVRAAGPGAVRNRTQRNRRDPRGGCRFSAPCCRRT